jgi:hypothetical protein
MMREELLSSVLGAPYDRETANCWHLVCRVQAELFGRLLPMASDRAIADRRSRLSELVSHRVYGEWQDVPFPVDGAVVIMTTPAHTHAGVYLVGLGVLHTDAPHGAVIDDPVALQARWTIAYKVPKSE